MAEFLSGEIGRFYGRILTDKYKGKPGATIKTKVFRIWNGIVTQKNESIEINTNPIVKEFRRCTRTEMRVLTGRYLKSKN